MPRHTSLLRILFYQLSNVAKWKTLESYFESHLHQSRHIPKGFFIIVAPTAFLTLGLTGIIIGAFLFMFELAPSWISIYFSIGVCFILLGALINYGFEIVVMKKTKELQSQSSQNKYLEDLKEIFSPLTKQLKQEKDLFLNSHANQLQRLHEKAEQQQSSKSSYITH